MEIKTQGEYLAAMEKMRNMAHMGPFPPESRQAKELTELVNAILAYQKEHKRSTS